MVIEILVAVAAGVAICHRHHKKQRINEALRRGCWRTSVPAPVVTAQAPEMDVKYDNVGAKDAGDAPMSGDERIRIPVRGPEEEPPAYMPGTGTVPPEKM